MSTINQKAYLQKYLAGSSGDKKKKKKKVSKGSGLKIIDDDIDLSKLRPLEGDELDILGEGEDAPQIAGIIDERPEEVKKLEQFKTSSKWRVINQDDGFNSKLQIEEIKRDVKEAQKENELIFGKMYSDSEDEKKNDSDLSPPRQKARNSEKGESKKPENSDSDISPPRRNNRASPQRKRSDKNDDSDLSPPRKQESQSDQKSKAKVRKPSRWGDAEENYRNRSKSHSPRRKKRKSESPVKHSRKSDNVISPTRKTKKHKNSEKNDDSDISPPRKTKKKEISESPPRQSRKDHKRNRTPDSDMSPPQKRKSSPYRNQYKTNEKSSKSSNKYGESSKQRRSPDSDLSPPRKKSSSNKRQKSASPHRKSRKQLPEKSGKGKQDSDSDLSPPRKEKQSKRDDRQRRNSESPPPSNKKMASRTLEGKLAGLQDATQLRQENEAFRRREEEVFSKMTDDVSGRNAKAVSRKSKRETSEERTKQKEKAERQKELDEKYKRWGKGLKQLEDQEARVQEFLHESAKPLARHRDDRDLESSLKQIERAGDPMLQYIRERKRERGELPPEKPTYKGNFPPNRFNIRPGYRWDGVDRSNGYEKKYFEQQSKRKAQEEEAYKWSTEDL